MNEWIWSSLSIQWGAARPFEAHFFIETKGLTVLLIDISGHSGMKRQAMTDQSCTNASPSAGWINEQCLHVAAVDEHECLRVIIAIHR